MDQAVECGGMCNRLRDLLREVQGDDGASALEFALILPILLVLIMGMVEFGWVYQAELAVTHAAREGARMAAVDTGGSWDSGLVAQRAYPLNLSGGLSVSRADPDASTVSVVVSYPYDWRLLPFEGPLMLSSTATMRKE